MASQVDKDSLRAAYEDVRSDASPTNWASFKFEGNTIKKHDSGTDISHFQNSLQDDDRAFVFVRVRSGDEMSKRIKFVLITYIGTDVSALKRARMSTDKALVKQIISNFAVELQVESKEEISENNLIEAVTKSGGASYGRGDGGAAPVHKVSFNPPPQNIESNKVQEEPEQQHEETNHHHDDVTEEHDDNDAVPVDDEHEANDNHHHHEEEPEMTTSDQEN
jgi:hypothetical protein